MRGSGREGLEVGTHHAFDAADARVVVDLVHGETLSTPAFTERFERDVEPDLVAVLEEIRDGFRGSVDAHVLAFDAMNLDAVGEGSAAEAMNSQARPGEPRSAGPPVDRDPHLVRELGADLMETQRGQQAHHCFRGGRGDEGEAVMLGDWSVRQPVPATRDPIEGALVDEAAQGVCVESGVGDFAPCDGPSTARQAKEAVGCPGSWHVAKCRQLFTTVNDSPLESQAVFALRGGVSRRGEQAA